MIEDLKFQQNQIAFKEQIALLEQIKSKQLELERMQKDEYKQEKELLRRKGELMRMQHSSRRSKTLRKDENTSELVVDDLHDVPDESKSEKKEHEDLNLMQTSNRTSARRPSSVSVTTPSSLPTTDRKIDQFVRNMEERARMREQLKREREEKKKKQEQVKLELMNGKCSGRSGQSFEYFKLIFV